MPGRLNGSVDIMQGHIDKAAARNVGSCDSGDGHGGGIAQALNHGEMRTMDDRKGTQ